MSNDSSTKNDPLFERLFAEAEACLDKRVKPDGAEDGRGEIAPQKDEAKGLPLRSKPKQPRAPSSKPIPKGRIPLIARTAEEESVVAIAEAKIDKLQSRLSTVKERAKRDQQLALTKQKDKMLCEFLTMLDDLERALTIQIDETSVDQQFASYKKGVQQVYEGGLQLLGQFGVERFESLNEEFDPNRHEAVRREPRDDMPANLVCEVFQNGYTVDGRLLRASRVSVSAHSS